MPRRPVHDFRRLERDPRQLHTWGSDVTKHHTSCPPILVPCRDAMKELLPRPTSQIGMTAAGLAHSDEGLPWRERSPE